ncbi:MAG: 3-methyl-2-oxobutanoate hydroxymethyltransferase [Verrucomicrobiota bacterium]
MYLKTNLISAKKQGYRQSWLTAYDYPSARLLDESGIDLILVGDSLGMVVLGQKDTIDVTLTEIIHHLKAVRRGVTRAPVAADLPFGTYTTPDQALDSAMQLVKAGADAVKLEGPLPNQVSLLTSRGIEVIGHLGMLPQQVREEGGYHRKGKTETEAESLLRAALELQSAGCCALVLELVETSLSRDISSQLDIPTIGIGSGTSCDGQILVTSDLLGLQPWFRPSFVKPKADLATPFRNAVKEFISEVQAPSL